MQVRLAFSIAIIRWHLVIDEVLAVSDAAFQAKCLIISGIEAAEKDRCLCIA